MAEPATTQRNASPAPNGRWFQKEGGSPVDKIPVLRAALADVARAWTDRFASLASAAAEVTLEGIEVCKVDEIVARRGVTSVLAVIQAPGWNTLVGLNFDRAFIATMVEALFGGGDEGVETGDATPLSPVDLRIAEVIAKQVAEALAAGFAKRLPSAFRVDGIQAKFDPSFLGKPATSVIIGTLVFTTLGAVVRLDVLMPLAALMVFADQLGDSSEPEEAYGDARWTQRLETEVGRATMALTARIDMDPMTLGFIAALREGQLIQLPTGAGNRVRLLCGEDELFRCDLGQSTGFYTVRVEDTVGVVEDQAGLEP